MAYKTFTATTLPASDLNTYLMNQAVITCTSGTHPGSPPEGMVIYETDTDSFFWWNSTSSAWTPWNTRLVYKTANGTLTSFATTAAVKDSGPGDLAFVVSSATQPYRIRYSARVQTDTAGTTVDIRIYDGGASSPTNGSTIVAGASMYLSAASGLGSAQLAAESIGTFSVGTHTLGGFYIRAAGTGAVIVGNATGGQRVLSVEMLTV